MDSFIEQVKLNMVRYFGQDLRRVNHALKVHSLARNIAILERLSPAELLILETVALLHDIGIKEAERQYCSCAAYYQELLGPGIARELVADFNLPDHFLARMDYLIGHHHTFGQIDAVDLQILVEADFLVNIGEGGLGKEAIDEIREKFFKTESGGTLLSSMFN